MVLMEPLVIYHANCADGFTAAWVCRRRLGDDCEFVAAHYQEPPPDVTDRIVYIVDFSYPREVLLRMAEVAKKVVVLDHHETAADALKGIEDEDSTGRLTTYFDMDRSGAGMTWDYFFPESPRPPLVNYVEDGDLWRFKLAGTRAYRAYLGTIPYSFEAYDEVYRADETAILAKGEAVNAVNDAIVKDAAKHATEVEFAGYKVLCTNATTCISAIGHELGKDHLFALTFFVRGDGKIVYSLRSKRVGGLAVNEIAKRYGGGGHKHAAGFVADTFVHTYLHGADR